MKAFASKLADKAITWYSKKLAKTGCFLGCHAPEAPEELYK